jgi:hypothetical protein
MHKLNFSDTLDKRIIKRVNELSLKMFRKCSPVIQRIAESRSEQIGFYRVLNNKRFTEDHIIEEQKRRCKESVSGKVILCIHDTTEANFFRHKNRLKTEDEEEKKSLGYTDAAKQGIGYKVHLSIAVDAKSDYIWY